MSPTSYQAAPPRVSARILISACPMSRSPGPFLAALAGPGRVRETVEDLLVAAHHAEIIARDQLLHPRVARQRALPRAQRVHLPLQRVELCLQSPLAGALREQVRGAVLPALHRERQ